LRGSEEVVEGLGVVAGADQVPRVGEALEEVGEGSVVVGAQVGRAVVGQEDLDLLLGGEPVQPDDGEGVEALGAGAFSVWLPART